MTVATFALAQLGEGLAQAGVIGIAGGVWLPNAVLATLAAISFWHARREGVLRRSLGRALGAAARCARCRAGGRPRRAGARSTAMSPRASSSSSRSRSGRS